MLEDAIQIANERISITKACSMIGMDVDGHAAASMKMYCPFGEIYHQDGGISKSFRVYPDTNSAWCFAGCGFFNPVKLVAAYRDLPDPEAAEQILLETGYVPEDFESRWEAAVADDFRVDTSALAQALALACRRLHPRWEQLQFDNEVSQRFNQCLSLLPKVRTSGDADLWLSRTRETMANTLRGRK